MTARTSILAYVVDFEGELDPQWAAILHAESVLPTYLHEYDIQREQWVNTWQAVIYKAAMHYYLRTARLVTPEILTSLLPQYGVPAAHVPGYLTALEEARLHRPLTEANIRHLIGQLRVYRTQREWERIAIEAGELMQRDPHAGIEFVQTHLAALQEETHPTTQIWDFRARARERWERHERFAAQENVHGHYTGLQTYDQRTRGMLPGEMLVLAGRTSQGKTAVLQHCAWRSVWRGFNVVFFSAEMGWSAEHHPLLDRFEAMATGWWKAQSLRWGTLGDEQQRAVLKTWFDLFSRLKGNLWIVPPQRCGRLQEIVAETRALARRNPIHLLVVDYINEITAGRREVWKDKHLVTEGLKRLAEEIGCPIITATQVSRHGHLRGVDADAAELASESEGIAKVTDSMIYLYRDKVSRDRLIFEVKKARLGETSWAFSAYVDFSIPLISGFIETPLNEFRRAEARMARDQRRLKRKDQV